MKIRLNYWQLILLFLPAIAGFAIFDLPHTTQTSFRIVNFLFNLNICLAICYQAYLVINYNNSRPNRSEWFNFNAYIPVVFNIVYLLYVSYSTFIKPYHTNLNIAPSKRIHYYPTTVFILFFLLHTAITYFVINNWYVSTQIKKLTHEDEREALMLKFLKPMKQLMRVSIIVIAGSFVISFILDIIRFM
jgi:hypothetical protein